MKCPECDCDFDYTNWEKIDGDTWQCPECGGFHTFDEMMGFVPEGVIIGEREIDLT